MVKKRAPLSSSNDDPDSKGRVGQWIDKHKKSTILIIIGLALGAFASITLLFQNIDYWREKFGHEEQVEKAEPESPQKTSDLPQPKRFSRNDPSIMKFETINLLIDVGKEINLDDGHKNASFIRLRYTAVRQVEKIPVMRIDIGGTWSGMNTNNSYGFTSDVKIDVGCGFTIRTYDYDFYFEIVDVNLPKARADIALFPGTAQKGATVLEEKSCL